MKQEVQDLKRRLSELSAIGFSNDADWWAERAGRLYAIAQDAIRLAERMAKEEPCAS